MATNMSNPGSAEEKLKWIFEMYDEDGSGIVVVNKAECSILEVKLSIQVLSECQRC